MGLAPLALHPASPDDGEILASLRVRAMRESLEQVRRFDPQRARDRILHGCDPAQTRLVVRGDTLIGFFVLRPLDGELLLDHLYGTLRRKARASAQP